MSIFLWIAFGVFVTVAVPSLLFYVAYLFTHLDRMRELAVRFFRWALLVVLLTFNISIFWHIVLTLLQG